MNRLTLLRATLAGALVLGTTAACGGSDEETPSTETSASASAESSPSTSASASASPSQTAAATDTHKPKVLGTVADGLKAPWGITFLPDKSALVSLRNSGEVKRVEADGKVTDAGKVPGVVHADDGEGGLLGLAVGPDFSSKPFVYAYFTSDTDNRVVRMSYEVGKELGKPEVVLDGLAKAKFHNGGGLLFGPDGMLYVGTGDASNPEAGQDDNTLNGKILRMTPDGEAPEDNPTADSLVFSKGHRNVQGLTFDPQKRLWASEFGQDDFDELNQIRAGKNYGWSVVEGTDGLDRYANPVRTWTPDEASPSGIVWAGGSIWLAGLKGERLWEVGASSLLCTPGLCVDDNPITTKPRDWLNGEHGRLRNVVLAPDGSLWLLTSNTDGRGDASEGDDKILRVEMGEHNT
jgi:glucose/arabinose dehydrogenase